MQVESSQRNSSPGKASWRAIWAAGVKGVIIDINNIIDRIELLVESSKSVPLSSNVIVDRGKLIELVMQLRMSIPQEIRRAEEMLTRKDDIMSSALTEANQARQHMEQEFRSRLGDHELGRKAEDLLREAELKCRRMMDQAEQEAEQRRNQADAYALRTLRDLERELNAAAGSVRKGIDALAGSVLTAAGGPLQEGSGSGAGSGSAAGLRPGSGSVPSPTDFAPGAPDAMEQRVRMR